MILDFFKINFFPVAREEQKEDAKYPKQYTSQLQALY